MNNEELIKKQNRIQLKLEKKAKLNTEVFELGQKIRLWNCIRILNDSIFVKFQLLNKYSKGVKRKCGLSKDRLYIQGWIIVK